MRTRNSSTPLPAVAPAQKSQNCVIDPCVSSTPGAHICKGKECGVRVHNICQTRRCGVEGMEVGFWCGGTGCVRDSIATTNEEAVDERVDEPSSRAGEGDTTTGAEDEHEQEESGEQPRCTAGGKCRQSPRPMIFRTRRCNRPCHPSCASDCVSCEDAKGECAGAPV